MDDRRNSVATSFSLDRLPLPPPLPLDDDEPWWVLPACKRRSDDDGFVLAGGAPATTTTTTPLAAMLARVVVAASSTSSSSTSSSSSASSSPPLPHADAAFAARLLLEQPRESVACFQSLLDRGGVEALAAVAASCPALAASAAVAAATATARAINDDNKHEESFPPDLSLFEASPLASSLLDALLRAPVTLQWAEAASKLSSSGATASWQQSQQQQQQRQQQQRQKQPFLALTEANLLPPASFARAAVSRALQAAQESQQEQEQRLASSSSSASASASASSSPAGPGVVGVAGETTTTTSTMAAAENVVPQLPQQPPSDFSAVRLAVALVRSMLRSSPFTKMALADAACRCELEAFCLASAASRDAAALFRDLKAGRLFQ